MKDCFIGKTGIEKCAPQKAKIDMCCPYNAIHFVLSGSGYFNGTKLTAGMGFMVLRREHVSYYPDMDDPWTYLWIIMYGNETEEFFRELELDHIVESPFIFTFSKMKELLSIYDAYKSKIEPLCKTKRISSSMLRLFLSLEGTPADKIESAPKNDYLKSSTEYIRLNYSRNISVDNIASMLGISRSYLRNIFYEAHGVSPQKYIINTRIARAKDLLASTSYTISAIAEECGYTDVLQFSKIFKKHTGVSPSHFRKMQLQ